MPAGRTTRIEVQPKGVVETVRALLRVEQRLDADLAAAIDEVGHRSVPIFASHALGGPASNLAQGISSRFEGGRAIVTDYAKNPTSGYDYVGVTRFGHRGVIVPRPDRQPASIVASRRPRATGATAALRFVIGGRVMYRRSVKGFHPLRDWAMDAVPQVGEMAQGVMDRLGRRIVVRGTA